jgi:protein pelota
VTVKLTQTSELNQLTGIAAILTFPLDVEIVEAEEREEAEARKKAQEEAQSTLN